MCTVLAVSRGGFYAWLVRPRVRDDERILVAMRTSFGESGQTYGVRRIWLDLQAWQIICGRERLARLMRAAALKARPGNHRLPKDTWRAAAARHCAECAGSRL